MPIKLVPFSGPVKRDWNSDSYEFNRQVTAWAKLPIVGEGTSSTTLLTWSPKEIREIFDARRRAASSQQSHSCGKFKKMFYTERSNRKILDFGCGAGYFAVELAKLGYEVSLADIRQDNLDAAEWAMNAFDYAPTAKYLVSEFGLDSISAPIDIFHSVGVLHHTPHIRKILRKAVEFLNPEGEIWLMLYTDVLFKRRTGNSDIGRIEDDIMKHPQFRTFVESCDPVGFYADWYNREKLEYRIGDFLDIISFEYLGGLSETAAVKLRPRHG